MTNIEPLDESHAMLFLGWLSREHLKYATLKDKGSCDWSSLKNLEKAFLAKYPNHAKPYSEFVIEKSKKWQKLFTEQFKKHELSMYVFDNRGDFEFNY